MKEIICPYCCKRYSPTKMTFRLRRSLLEQKISEISADVAATVQDDAFATDGMGASAPAMPVQGNAGSSSTHLDQKLYDYYMNIEQDSTDNAYNKSLVDTEAVDINFPVMLSNGDITEYDKAFYSHNGFVTELTYKGQRLTDRLCPECHNPLTPNAGRYDMKIIAMYGNTKSGKTVYLHVLEAVLAGDHNVIASSKTMDFTPFNGMLAPEMLGKVAENYRNDHKLLIESREMVEATKSGDIVPPIVYHYTYTTRENLNQQKDLLLVFRDIPGEDTQDPVKIKKYSFYLKNADAIMVMVDSSDLAMVKPHIANQETKASKGYLPISLMITNLKNMLGGGASGKIEVPTAVMLSKSDVLSSTGILAQMGLEQGFREHVWVPNSNHTQHLYYDRLKAKKMHEVLRKTLKALGEGTSIVIPFETSFTNFSYFSISALGGSPTKDKRNVNNKEVTAYVMDSIKPFRIAEPFFWILSRLSCVPYIHKEEWVSNKGDKDLIQFAYYENERNGAAQKRLEEIRRKKGRKPGKTGILFGKTWEYTQNDSI